ncbi:MAG TPA: malic enzyme-like NAD(P)-binding protein, partial [Blastocatellia bacterium]|nr:malic enzyme-like NAD(P)-binding protein [Blastocatellia bacterium]
GAGSAATGVADMIVASIVRGGISAEEARAGIWMLDIGGLLHSKRSDLESFNAIYAQPFERISEWGYSESDRITLPDVVHRVQSSVLIGLSGQSGAFGESVVREMAAHTDRPVIFPLSNPTALSEGIPSDLTEWTDGRALIATGSPFPPVSFDGQSRHTAQCNNVYIFPGVGLGVIASGARRVSDAMFMAAAEALSDLSPAFTDSGGPLLPEIDRVREVSRRVAIAVGVEAQKEGLAPAMEAEEWEHRVDTVMWQPRYATYRKVKTVG